MSIELIREILSGVALSGILFFVIGGTGYGVWKAAKWTAETLVKPLLHVIDAWWEKTNQTLEVVQRESERQTDVLATAGRMNTEHSQQLNQVLTTLQGAVTGAIGRSRDVVDLVVNLSEMIEVIAKDRGLDVHQQVSEIKQIAHRYRAEHGE